MSTSTTMLKPVTGQGLMHWKSETKDCMPMTGVCVIIDGILSKKDIAKLLNKRLISNPQYSKFKSIVTQNGYYKILPQFDSKMVLKQYTYNQSVSSPYDSPSSSDSDNNSNTSNTTDQNAQYSVISSYLSTHINKYHNIPFKKRNELPLWRGHIIHFSNISKTVFYLKCHHVICDGISLSKIFLGVADNYKSIAEKNKKLICTSSKYKQYKNRWNYPILYMLFILLNFMLWLLDFCVMLIFHKETKSKVNISAKKMNKNKSYSVLYNVSNHKINKIRKEYMGHVTINDFMLAILAESISKYLAENDNVSMNNIIKLGTVISMNARPPSGDDTINCMVGCSQINLPICNNNLSFINKLKYIKSQMDTIKKRQYSMFSCYLLLFTGALPKFIVEWLISLQNASVIVTNICGPRNDILYLNGKQMLCASGVVQNNPGIALSFCVTGYNGQLSVSLLADYNIDGPKTAEKIMGYVKQMLQEKNCLL